MELDREKKMKNWILFGSFGQLIRFVGLFLNTSFYSPCEIYHVDRDTY